MSESNHKHENPNLKYYLLDVTNLDQIKNVSQSLLSDHMLIDLFINNAGIFIRGDTILMPVIHKTMNVNFFGPKNIFEIFLKNQNFSKNCKINFVSSQMGNFTRIERNPEVYNFLLKYENQDFYEEHLLKIINQYLKEIEGKNSGKSWSRSVYALSKLFLSIYVSILSRKHKNFHFLSLCPGWCVTDMTKGSNAPKTAAQGGSDIVKGIMSYQNQKLSGKFVKSAELWDIKENIKIELI